MRDNSPGILFQSSLQDAVVSSKCWHWHGRPLLDLVHPAFSLPITASSTLRDALKDYFGEAVVACDIPEQCVFPSLDSCQESFLLAHKEVDLASHLVVGLIWCIIFRLTTPQRQQFSELPLEAPYDFPPLFSVSAYLFCDRGVGIPG